jgi:hypothetical protein
VTQVKTIDGRKKVHSRGGEYDRNGRRVQGFATKEGQPDESHDIL